MNELTLANRAADWHRLKALVLDSVSSPITKRVYNLGLDEFIAWYGQEPRPGFTKATVAAWRVALEGRGLGSVSINVRITAVRKLAVEAADNGLLAPELANGITRVKGGCFEGRPSRELALSEAGASAPERARDHDDDGSRTQPVSPKAAARLSTARALRRGAPGCPRARSAAPAPAKRDACTCGMGTATEANRAQMEARTAKIPREKKRAQMGRRSRSSFDSRMAPALLSPATSARHARALSFEKHGSWASNAASSMRPPEKSEPRAARSLDLREKLKNGPKLGQTDPHSL
jgi:hypothetical protein